MSAPPPRRLSNVSFTVNSDGSERWVLSQYPDERDCESLHVHSREVMRDLFAKMLAAMSKADAMQTARESLP